MWGNDKIKESAENKCKSINNILLDVWNDSVQKLDKHQEYTDFTGDAREDDRREKIKNNVRLRSYNTRDWIMHYLRGLQFELWFSDETVKV